MAAVIRSGVLRCVVVSLARVCVRERKDVGREGEREGGARVRRGEGGEAI